LPELHLAIADVDRYEMPGRAVLRRECWRHVPILGHAGTRQVASGRRCDSSVTQGPSGSKTTRLTEIRSSPITVRQLERPAIGE
jgi:hypothetical protein